MAISSVTLLNSDGVNAAAALVRQGTAQEIIAAAEKEAASPTSSNFSSVSLISSSGKAKLSLESFQARAEALGNADVPPTVSDFKVVVQGVVGSINELRTTLFSALAEIRNGSPSISRAKEFVDRISAGDKDSGALALARKAGVETQGDGSFAINQKQLSKAFNEDGKGAFSALQEFAAKLAQAKDAPPPDKKDDTEKSKDAMRRADAADHDREAGSIQQVDVQQQDVQQQDVQQQDFQTQLSSQLASASGFTAQTAVTSYLTVASL